MDNVVTPQGDDMGRVLDYRQYGIDTRDAIRSALAGYVGGTNIIGELVQNADDAEATTMQFHFGHEALVVKNNSYFRESDFNNILAIASGGKRDETGRIGTWGTGFLSVYHLTDSPELHSDGQSIRFDPAQRVVPIRESRAGKETVFVFPWRREQTELSRRIEARVWSDADVRQLLEEIGPAIYRQLIFLRHVDCIEVYDGVGQEGSGRLLYRVCRGPGVEEKKIGFTRERREIEYQRAGAATRTDPWLYYRGQVPRSFAVPGVTIKDFGITIAFPVKSTEWLEKSVPGTLYNFLPTPIQTGFGFQMNGAFFPDSNRRSILFDDSTQPEKSKWNRQVIRSLSDLLSSRAVIVDIRDQVGEARRFYELLPVRSPKDEQTFLRPVSESFAAVAAELPIVQSSLGTWCLPRDVYMPQGGAAGSKLRELAAAYMPVLPTEIPQQFLDFLRRLPGMQPLTWRVVTAFLKPHLEEGKRLTATHAMINTKEKLKLFYSALPQPAFMDDVQLEVLGQTCLCLAEDDTVWTFSGGQVWRADTDTRKLLEGTGIRFVHAEVQKAFAELVQKLAPEFGGADLVEWLGEQEWPEEGFSLDEAPAFIRGRDHLAELLRFIASDLKEVSARELGWLPLVLTEANTLVASDGAYLHSDARDRAFFTELGMAFVDPELAADEEIGRVYKKAGVSELEPGHIIRHLQRHITSWVDLTHEEKVRRLHTLYDYFTRHEGQFTESDLERLRELPVCMDQRGNLAPAGAEGKRMFLPPAGGRAVDRAMAHLDALGLQYIVHNDLQVGDGYRFLKSVLGLTPLSPAELIEQLIVPHYSEFSDGAKQDLLFYISEHLRSPATGLAEAILAKLKEHDLIRCEDGVYRRATQVYFASAGLDAVFGDRYHKLHPSYGVPMVQADADQTRQSRWYWLLSNLGVNESPAAADLVIAVERQVTGTVPTDERVEVVRRIYNLLNETEGGKKLLNTDVLALRPLASMKWLPATNDRSRWFLPDEVYPSQFSSLIGKQAPILAFNQTSIELRKLLPTPTAVPPSIAARHLLALAAEKQEILLRIYEFLGDGWEDIDPDIQRQLKEAAIVWDRKSRYWPGNQVFLGDYRNLFGARRCQFETRPPEKATHFLLMIGAKERPDGWRDQVAMLREIAEEYSDGSPISNIDRDLLLATFDNLGRLHDEVDLQGSADAVRRYTVIPDQHGVLHLPERLVLADRPELLDHFDDGSVSVVAGSIPAEGVALSDAAFRFLVRAGVPRLSGIVKRKVSQIRGPKEDGILGVQVRALQDALLRISISVHERQEPNIDTQKIKGMLASIKLFACNELSVEYVLDTIGGWRVQGHRQFEQALYDEHSHSIYVVTKEYTQVPRLPLAQELVRMLDLSRESVSLLERLLELPLAQVDAYLTDRGYARLYADTLSVGANAAGAEMVEWDATGEDWSDPDEDAAEMEPEDTTGAREEEDEIEYDSVVAGAHSLPVDTVPYADDGTKVSEKAHEGQAIQPEPIEEGAGQTPRDGHMEWEVAPGASPHGTGAGTTQDGGEAPDGYGGELFEDEVAGDEHSAPKELDRYTGPTRPYDASSDRVGVGDSDSEVSIESDTDEIPAFTGQIRPTSPRRPVNYGRLEHKYGLTRHGVGDATQEEGEDDTEGVGERSGEDQAREAQPVTVVRFVLKFANRYEGFLPLHSYARRMFPGRPDRLRCQVEYGEEEFDLYLDYDLGVIYNQEALPALFAAHNIPAGGVVYLQLVHGNTVRLYWRRKNNEVRKVLCLEMGEDGSVQEFFIDVAQYPCEIAEYVVRAEKRFEDMEALFKEALDKGGLFETICDVFGEPGRELSYEEIFHRVQAIRKVATASIDFQLYQRPCFVEVKSGVWRFEPHRGYDPYSHTIRSMAAKHEPAEEREKAAPPAFAGTGTVEGTRGESAPTPAGVPATGHGNGNGASTRKQSEQVEQPAQWERAGSDSPSDLISRVVADLQQIERLPAPGNEELYEQLLQLAKELERVGKEIAARVTAATTGNAIDPTLLMLWQQIGSQPQDEKTRATFITYVGEAEPAESQQSLLGSLRGLLLQTAREKCEYIYWPLLSKCAERARDADLVTWAKMLYELLAEEGAGDFSRQLEQIGESSKVEEYLEIILKCESSEERWGWIHEAWVECNGSPRIRTLVQKLLKDDIEQDVSRVEEHLTQARIEEAIDEYTRFAGPLLKVVDAWSTTPYAFKVWTLAGKLVDAVMNKAATGEAEVKAARTALRLVGQLPEDAHRFIPADLYLIAAVRVARELEVNREFVAAALLLEYTIQCVGHRAQRSSVELSQAHETASRLYEQLEAYGRAYSHLSAAHTLEVARKVPYDETKKTGWHCTTLRNERDKRDSALEEQTWFGWANAVVEANTLGELVNGEIFAERMRI